MKKSIVYLSLAVLFVSTLSTSVFVLAQETQSGEIKAPEEVSLGRERTVTANQKKCFALQGEPDTKRVTVNRGNETIKIVELHEGEITPICHTYAEEGTYRVKLPNPEGIVSLYLQEEVTHFQKGNANNLNGGNWTEEITKYGELSESTEVSKEEALPTENFPYEGGTEGGFGRRN
ncbi:MAG: hypothetical protein PHR46_03790 [Candidatus Absconditabacteria bacterium]|nr:hypothetical protein [Candidatus Absconditabacteria bacterium]